MRRKQFWLVKSEPDAFSWDQQVAKGVEPWTGVRNALAALHLRAMRRGDRAFFYHSNIGKEIVGIMKVIALAHPDSTAEPNDKGKIIWECVDVAPVRPLKTPVTLEQVKTVPGLENLALIKLSRLSVQPVTDKEWAIICKLGGL